MLKARKICQIKIGYNGKYISQNELLKKNDLKLAKAMYLNLSSGGTHCIGDCFVGIADSDILYIVLRCFKCYGYPVNEATKK